MDLHSTEFVA